MRYWIKMKHKVLATLAHICKDLRLLEQHDLTDKVLCAYAALSDIESKPKVDLSYTYIMRKLRQEGNEDRTKAFQVAFKDAFERGLDEDIENPTEIALMMGMKAINWSE